MKKWTIDPDHSVAGFTVRHMMLIDVHGQFNKIAGTIYFDPADTAHSSVEATIETSGVYTGISKRDDHIRSADFFDAANHPRISFKSTKVEVSGGNRLTINGDLTIRGNTRAVTFDAEYVGPVKSPFDEDVSMGFRASTVIDRRDFGVLWNEKMDGGVVAGWNVRITLDIEADLAA